MDEYISTHTGQEIDQGIDDISTHKVNMNNPHNVTKAQLGLDQVDNTADLDKPLSTAQSTALNAREDVGNKTTSITGSSTNTQYPSAKAVYTFIQDSIVNAMEGQY